MTLASELRAVVEAIDFSGVVVVSRGGERAVEIARGVADRADARPITLDTRFPLASVTKGLTALAAVSLVEDGSLRLDTTLRSLLGDDLPLVDARVTIEHLLAHTSGVGDYIDEEELDDVDAYLMPVPVHKLDRPEAYLPVLDGFAQRSEPGTAFAYNNGAYVMLSIAIERASGRGYYDLVQERVLDPAGMAATGFDRSDRPRSGTACGYLEDGRTNILHLPVRGAGDGGIVSTVRDLESFWGALFAGAILPMESVERLVVPRSDVDDEGRRYGMGFWLRADRPTVMLEGMDAGISARTSYDRPSGLTYTVVSNTSSGAWPLVEFLDERLPSLASRYPA